MPFEFHNPTRLIFEAGKFSRLGELPGGMDNGPCL